MTSARRVLSRLLVHRSSRLGRTIAPLVALAVLSAAFIAGRSLEVDPSRLFRWEMILATALSGLLIALTSMEYQLTAQLSGISVPFKHSLRVAIYAGLANLLPLPGGILVKLERLNAQGVKLLSALWSNIFVGGVWVGLASVTAGVVLYLHNERLAAAFAAALGLILVSLPVALLRKPVMVRLSLTLRAIALETAFIVIASARIRLTGQALGVDLDLTGSVLLAVTSVLATTIGIIPGGWGIWELLSAAIAPLIGLAPAVALLTAATVRLQNIVGLGVGMGLISLHRRQAAGQAGSAT